MRCWCLENGRNVVNAHRIKTCNHQVKVAKPSQLGAAQPNRPVIVFEKNRGPAGRGCSVERVRAPMCSRAVTTSPRMKDKVM